ncbi:MAG: class I SAM-dependent methyltransferase [Campylobacteraceae bacterium]|nr:class I SAM-dependent methyltransferase [Campylobacteraceae bacterium]
MISSHSKFTGEIPKYYERYLGPIIFEEYAEDLANRVCIPSNGTLLEIAAGTGMATRKLRDTLSSTVHIIATDITNDMLDIAKTKFNEKENIEFKIANALELPFEDGTFDVVVCQFSLMFFPNKSVAVKEAKRVLKPGGTFVFNVWDSFEHNQLVQTVSQTIMNCLPFDPPSFFKVPFGYYNIDVIKTLLNDAGFGDIEIDILPRVSKAQKALDVASGFVLGTPARLQIEEDDSEPLDKILGIVTEAIGKKFGYTSIKAKMQAIIFTAYN